MHHSSKVTEEECVIFKQLLPNILIETILAVSSTRIYYPQLSSAHLVLLICTANHTLIYCYTNGSSLRVFEQVVDVIKIIPAARKSPLDVTFKK